MTLKQWKESYYSLECDRELYCFTNRSKQDLWSRPFRKIYCFYPRSVVILSFIIHWLFSVGRTKLVACRLNVVSHLSSHPSLPKTLSFSEQLLESSYTGHLYQGLIKTQLQNSGEMWSAVWLLVSTCFTLLFSRRFTLTMACLLFSMLQFRTAVNHLPGTYLPIHIQSLNCFKCKAGCSSSMLAIVFDSDHLQAATDHVLQGQLY